MPSTLKIYNTLSREKEVFQPLNPPFVGLYACGPTVYNEVHLGNLRSFTTFDVVYRYLTHLGYKVRYVRNITDAGHLTDDADAGESKIEVRAKLEQLEPMEIVQKYTTSFHEVCDIFNLMPPSIEPTATGHIVEQIEMVKRILANGYAYEVNGSVYFDVKKYMETHPYGQLSGRNVDDLMEVTRELSGTSDKKNSYDFALWIKTPDNALQKWPSPWGDGCPGWHLECSAMSGKYLGQQFDIHGGGMDLKFPHHECEIAQGVGADGVNPVRYWMHANMLTVNGEKMSKSKGNSFLPKELFAGAHKMLDKAYAPMAVKFFMMQSHYRSTLDFSNEALQAAEKGYAKLMNAYENLQALVYTAGQGTRSEAEDKEVNDLCEQIYDKMNDDFNTAEVTAILFEMSKKINSFKEGHIAISSIDEATFKRLKDTFTAFVRDILAIDKADAQDDNTAEGLMDLILSLRKDARDKKDFATSDKIRDALLRLSIQVKDGKEGTTWSKN
ncbi:MAG: cysteine--tRNA ligase [Bacteroidetes bacterium]|nr:cysteine--tRNA ligase [Bacteroidota bacterium]